mmetsp:Transcript_14608/g.41840  ORF Transcript_14608/g.41840 Transcript_14608/m.41840 type:complete len:267 (+) Transcript_14608:73-873(+)
MAPFLKVCMAIPAVAAVSVLRTSPALEPVDACSCLNWKQTYATKNVKCGTTVEFYSATGRTALDKELVDGLQDMLGNEYCSGFFEGFDSDICANVNKNEDKGQWCFVDSACPTLNGGAAVNPRVSWKMCNFEKDNSLRNWSVVGLAIMAADKDLDLGRLYQMSYTQSPHLWKEVAPFFGVGLDGLTTEPRTMNVTRAQIRDYFASRFPKEGEVSGELRLEMQKIVDSGKPVWFETDDKLDHGQPWVIVKGTEIYFMGGELLCMSGC